MGLTNVLLTTDKLSGGSNIDDLKRPSTTSETGVQEVTSQTVSFVVRLVYGIRKIFRP